MDLSATGENAIRRCLRRTQINVNGAQLPAVDNFTYLNSTISRNTKIDDEVARRVFKASQVFCRLQDTVWNRYGPHQTEVVQDGHPVNAAVSSGDLDDVQKAGKNTQPFPPQLPPADTKTEHPDDTTRCPPSTSDSSPAPVINTDRMPEPSLPSSSIAPTSAATPPEPTTTAVNPNTTTNVNLIIANTSDVDSVNNCPHCDRTFTSHIGLIGHLRIHRTETV
nr:unnamed protein product [Spirometra erinaceieuropaei]